MKGCLWCQAPIRRLNKRAVYCSVICRHKAKHVRIWQRKKRQGILGKVS